MSILNLFRGMAQNGNLAQRQQGAAPVSAPAQTAPAQGGGFWDGIGGGVRKVFPGLAAPEDPQAIDPQTGMPMGMVHAAKLQSLQRLGMLMMAAGQDMTGAQRAQIMAQGMGEMDPSKQLYTMAQAKLMNDKLFSDDKKQKAKAAAAEKLRSLDLSGSLTPREQAVYGAFLESGDTDGALDFLTKTSSQTVVAPDGSPTSRGVLMADTQNWNKQFQPVVQSAPGTLAIANNVLDFLDAGVLTGSTSNYKLAMSKLAKDAGVEIPDEVLNTEKMRGQALNLVIDRMKDLGGNDSYEELQKMSESLAGDKLEEGTIRNNIRQLMRRKIKDAYIAEVQKSRVGTSQYGLSVDFDPKNLPGQYKQLWDRTEMEPGPKKGGSAPSTAPAAGGEGSGYKLDDFL